MSQHPTPTPIEWIKEHLIPQGDYLMQWASYAMILGTTVAYVINPPAGLQPWRFYLSLFLLGALLILNFGWIELERSSEEWETYNWVYLPLAGALIIVMMVVGRTNVAYLLFMLLAQALIILSVPAAIVSAVVYMLLFMGAVWLTTGSIQAPIDYITSLAAGIAFVVVLTLALRESTVQRMRAENLLEELRQTNDELIASRAREKELAAATERVRLAREIHDGLGHHLTVLNVQLQAASKLIERDVERAAGVIEVCREQAQAALTEVRRSVAVMRRSPLDGKSLEEAIQRLVAEFSESSTLAGRFEQQGQARDLPAATTLTLYRAAQEGLTNAQKHAAGAQEVIIALAYDAEQTTLRVRNDGPHNSGNGHHTPTLLALSGGGFGLAGLKERAEQLGGRFRAGPQPDGGFLLEITLPTTTPTKEAAYG